MSVQFLDGAADDAARLRSFFGDMYHADYVLSRSEPFLRWQFAAVPSTARNGLDVKLATVDGAIAGCVGYIPVALDVAGTTLRAAWAANWMVDDRYRRLGLGPLLMRELSREFDVTLALGGNRDAHALLPRMGWTDFGDLPRYVGVLDARRAGELGNVDGMPIASVNDGGAVRVGEVPAEATALWDRVRTGTAGTRRSAEYLTWRYLAHPLFEYRVFALSRQRRLAGLGIYRLETARDYPITVGRIVEILALPGDVLPLVQSLARDAAGAGAAIIDFFCPLPRLAPELEQAGLTARMSSRFPMLFQPIDRTRTGVLFMADLRKAPPAARLAEWYVTTSDGDQDRPN